MKRTKKTGYMIKDEDDDYHCFSDFWPDYGEVFFDEQAAKDALADLKSYGANVRLVTVEICEIDKN